MNLRPPRAQQWLPPRGEPCDRRLPATSEASVAHGKPDAADMLRGRLLPPPLLSDAPSLPSHHLSFSPSNSRFSSLFAHNFSFNYYKMINKKNVQSPSCCPGAASLPPRQQAGFRFIIAQNPELTLWATESIAPYGAKIVPASAAFSRSGVASPPPATSATTVAKSRGGFDESTPTQGSAMAPTCGEGASAYAYAHPWRSDCRQPNYAHI